MESESIHTESKQWFYHLEICCRCVGEKFGHPVISGWTNGDYIQLSGVLSRQMNVQISPNTLKRIFGKLKTTDRYYPQKVTRDTLARYAGFIDWDEFVQKHPRPKSEEAIPEKILNTVSETVHEPLKEKALGRSHLRIEMLSMLIIAALTIWWLRKDNETVLPAPGDVDLVCENSEGTNPHSAVFRLKLSKQFKGRTNNFILDFGDQKTRHTISADKLLTHYYEIPGRYYPVLLYNDVPLDTISVYLKTNGWTATANMQTDSTRVYPLADRSLFKGKNLRVSTGELSRAGVDTGRTFFVHFVNTTPLEVSGDHFELTATVRASEERPGVRCSQVNVTVFGQESRHFFSLMKLGCASFNGLQFSENVVSGVSEDLRNMSRDLSGGGTLKLQVSNLQGKLWINDKPVYQASYQKPLGRIFGVEVLFSGIGELYSMKLKDLRTGVVYNEQLEPVTHLLPLSVSQSRAGVGLNSSP